VTPAPRRATAFALLVALVGATAWCAAYAEGWPSDNRPVVWMKDAHADPGFGVLRDRFGGDDAVLLRVAPATPADADRARAFAFALGPRLGALPAVLRALDPFRLPAAPRADDARIAAARAASRPIARALGLLDPAADRYDFVVRVRPDAAQTECGALARALDALRGEAAAAGAKLEAGGHPLVAAALDDEARRVERVFSPLLALASVLGVALFFRSFALAALTVLPAALASVAARAGTARRRLGPEPDPRVGRGRSSSSSPWRRRSMFRRRTGACAPRAALPWTPRALPSGRSSRRA
jgi:hypothetical protein